MDNLDHQTANPRAMLEVLRHRDAWFISLLYIGTFGSFIGFGFAFGQVLNQTFLAGMTGGAAPPRPRARREPARRADRLHRAAARLGQPGLGRQARRPARRRQP